METRTLRINGILIYVVLLCVNYSCSSFTRLPHGTFVEDQGELQIIESKWTLLVNIERPRPDSALREQFKLFLAQYTNITGLQFSPIVEGIQRHRIKLIKREMLRLYRTERTARGLLNIGGKILNSLFGVVTESQLNAYKRLVSTNQNNIEKLYHDRDIMASVLNQTVADVALNEKHIQLISKYVSQLQEYYNINFETNLIDIILTSFEITTAELLRQVDIFEQQKRALEMGHLTEQLLSPDELKSILQTADLKRFSIINPIFWYYEHCSVKRVFINNNKIFYLVILPLVDLSLWQLYNIQSWPFPMNSTNTFVKIDIYAGHYAIHPPTGRLIRPILMGNVADRTVMWQDSAYKCVRSIIQHTEISECATVTTQYHKTSIFPLEKLNEVVVVANDVEYTSQCGVGLSKPVLLRSGAYHLHVEKECKYSFENFIIKAVETEGRNFTKLWRIPQLTLGDAPLKNWDTSFGEVTFLATNSIFSKRFKDLSGLSTMEMVPQTHHRIVNSTVSVITIFILIIVIYLVIRFKRKSVPKQKEVGLALQSLTKSSLEDTTDTNVSNNDTNVSNVENV